MLALRALFVAFGLLLFKLVGLLVVVITEVDATGFDLGKVVYSVIIDIIFVFWALLFFLQVTHRDRDWIRKHLAVKDILV